MCNNSMGLQTHGCLIKAIACCRHAGIAGAILRAYSTDVTWQTYHGAEPPCWSCILPAAGSSCGSRDGIFFLLKPTFLENTGNNHTRTPKENLSYLANLAVHFPPHLSDVRLVSPWSSHPGRHQTLLEPLKAAYFPETKSFGCPAPPQPKAWRSSEKIKKTTDRGQPLVQV